MNRLPLAEEHTTAGATWAAEDGLDLPASYGDPAREAAAVRDAAGLVDLSERGVFRISGAGAAETLHGLLSSSVKDLAALRAQPSCLLSAKGRVVGAFDLQRTGKDEFHVAMRERPRAGLFAGLQKYLFLSDLELVDVSAELAVVAIQGPRADALLSRASGGPGELAPGAIEIRTIASVPCRVSTGGETPEGGVFIWVPQSGLVDVWRAIRSAFVEGENLVGREAYEELRVEAGAARYGIDYDEEAFPNEIGWDSALSYDKCYVGQEVVARMRTYGEVNRKLRGLLSDDREVARGARVLAGDDEIGLVTSSVRSSRLARTLSLARVKRRFWGEREVTIETGNGRTLAVQTDLPFVRLDGTEDAR